jgi:hypothetical protein
VATYKVIKPGFHDGRLYDPVGKRKILTVDKPFKKTPAWLELVKSPTKKEAAATKKVDSKKKKDDEEKAKEDKKEIDAVSFVEKPKSVQTL